MDIIPHTQFFLQQFDKIYLDFMHHFNVTEKQQNFLFSIVLDKKNSNRYNSQNARSEFEGIFFHFFHGGFVWIMWISRCISKKCCIFGVLFCG